MADDESSRILRALNKRVYRVEKMLRSVLRYQYMHAEFLRRNSEDPTYAQEMVEQALKALDD